MYTIKEASARTGVGAPLIRAWERRYGVIEPTRTPSGYRLYDDATLRTLVAMRALVDSGWTASEAARAIRAGEVNIDELVGSGVPSTPVGATGVRHREALIDRFVRAAESTSAADTEAVLDEMLATGSFEAVVDDLLMPAARALGEAWAEDRVGVASEHAASAAIARRLAAAFQAAGVAARPAVVVGLPPGSRHELGALAFAAALRRRDVGVLYLGADVPVEGWVDAVGATRARAAVMGVVTPADREAAIAVIQALRANGARYVAVGGDAAAELALPADVVRLPAGIVEAAGIVASWASRRG
jgi:DNA-binding transcriptional MerR regulator